ncbi:MAG: NERD domain-containing protein [Herbinix sp.]|nr:NERD domain-containing protein [Herbinix sp.]
MGLFNKMKEPIFLKESSNAQDQLERLRALEPQLNEEGQEIIRQDIKCLEYGIAGEKNIAFELKNSHMPMYILHDIYLEDGDLSAQIDYLVFTKKMCFVIECKNLCGNVEITNTGDFIRTTNFGGRKKKEGIYSPITQNQRHLELMKKIKVDIKSNIITKLMIGKYFEDFNKSVVVLANPKTVINAKYAKKEVKSQVIRADQLVRYIKDFYEKSKDTASSDEKMLAWAKSYLDLHKEVDKDYTEKYEQYKVDNNKSERKARVKSDTEEKSPINVTISIEKTEIFKELKAYRLAKSREENIKPYFIYNDNQLKDLIFKMPRSEEELIKVDGFGKVKADKYGDDIFKIVNKY